MSEADNSTFEWSQDLTVNLAEFLEGERVLWDKSHKDYKKGNAKHDALKRIADRFGTTPLVVQNKLNNIRSQFLREEKKISKKESEGTSSGNNVSRWFLFDHLKFLSGYAAEVRNNSRSRPFRTPLVTEEEIVTVNEDGDDLIYYTDPEGQLTSYRPNAEALGPLKGKVDFSKSYVTVSRSSYRMPEAKEEKEKEREEEKEDDCDIFGRLVAKRMRMIENPVLRLAAEQEIGSCIARKLCEDSGIEDTPFVRAELPPSFVAKLKSKYPRKPTNAAD